MKNREIFRARTVRLMMGMLLLVALPAFSAAPAPDRAALVDGNTQLACDLYQKLRLANEGRNLFFSPFSVSTALAMTYSGAAGETERQMAAALRFTLPQQRLHPAFSALLDDLNGAKGYELAIANRLWGQKNYPFRKEFLAGIDARYRGGFEQVDYQNDAEGARRTINRWVEAETRGKIRDLLRKPDIKPLTRLVLTNAIYFKGNWSARFDPRNTVAGQFAREDGASVSTPLMTQKGKFPYLREKEFEMLELPYAGGRLSMLVLLPNRGVPLDRVEAQLSSARLRSWRSGMEETDVRLFLPRFRTAARFELNAPLDSLGMKDAFDEDRADFSGITKKKGLYISKVIHKAFVDVNEEGTEAAAATAVVMSTKSIGMEVRFRADRPFVFAIVDRESESVLFLGRLMNPEEPEE